MSLLKNCKVCGAPLVEPKPNTKRHYFCSNHCKNEFNRKKKENKITTPCVVCSAVMYHYVSQKRKTCSKICSNKLKIQSVLKTCKNCSKCYETKPANKSMFCSRNCQHIFGRVIKLCPTCGKEFVVKKSKDKQKVRCSRKCQFLDQSRGIIHVCTNGRTGWRKDLGENLYFKSSLEADFVRFLRLFSIDFLYEQKSFEIDSKFYTPDFFIESMDLYIELKGPEKHDGNEFSTMMRKNLKYHDTLAEQGFNILTITQKQFIKTLKENHLWNKIPNLEQRNYKRTKELVVKHS